MLDPAPTTNTNKQQQQRVNLLLQTCDFGWQPFSLYTYIKSTDQAMSTCQVELVRFLSGFDPLFRTQYIDQVQL